MRRRILTAMVSVATLAVIGFGIPLAFLVERFVEDDAIARVERVAVLATRDVSSDFATSGDPVELRRSDDGIVVSLYDLSGARFAGDGPVVADSVTRRALGNAVVDGEVDGDVVVAVPVSADEQVVGVMRAARPSRISDDRTARLLLLLVGLGVAVITISGALGWVLAGRLSRPVRQLRDAARQLGDGDFGVEVPVSTITEIDQAAAALSATAARLGELIGRERAFSADASHQLRTPIAGMRAAIEAELTFPRDDSHEILHEVLSDLDRVEQTVADLLSIARSPEPNAPVDLTPVLAEVEAAWRRRLHEHGRELRIGPSRFAPGAIANTAMLRHALDVLVDNAVHHGDGAVSVTVSASSDTVTITVADEGLGFPADHADHERGGDGRGLGLGLAHRLVEAMGGRLIVAGPGAGAVVDVVLRRADTATA